MLKNIFFILCLSQLQRTLWAQAYDHYWITGLGYCDTQYVYIGTSDLVVDSNLNLSIFPSCRDSIVTRFYNAFICDKEGSLQCFTTGCRIYNSYNQVIQGGDSINYGNGQYWNNENGAAYPLIRGGLILPYPDQEGRYILFHQYGESTAVGGGYREYSPRTNYTVIDMSLNGGQGAVIERETLLSADTLATASLSACQHANGRDWWLILPKSWSNCYDLWLLDPQGVHYQGRQCLGHQYYWAEWWGQASFSPDGEYFVRNTSWDDVHLFSFDRCTGQLGAPRHLPFVGDPIHIGDADPNSVSGIGFSPNSRYLYATASTILFQYDLAAADIPGSRQTIDVFSYHYDPILPTSCSFGQHVLVPDGRILINGGTSSRFCHYIEYPDSAGIACQFHERGITSPTAFSPGTPNYPHFRSSAVDGSACDTLGLNSLSMAPSWLDFGTILPGTDSTRQVFLRSQVGYPATVRQLDIDGGAPFSVDTLPSNYSIPKYDSVMLTVHFAPPAVGFYEDTLWAYTNYGRVAVRLTGRADAGVGAISTPASPVGLSVRPNPATGTAWLECDVPAAQNTELRVMDALGRVVYSQLVRLNEGRNSLAIPLGGLASGVYAVGLLNYELRMTDYELLIVN